MIKQYLIDNKKVFVILNNSTVLYADTDIKTKIVSKENIEYKDVNIPFEYGKIVKIVTCKTSIYTYICNAVALLDNFNDNYMTEIYHSLLKELTKLA
ncbi:hypothetical protein [Acidianus brierleyi]|uniref:Uncharacterized protein n=1 Tax=Acidianus brierleyi TaxID=41673 RepID=A0A2U9IGB2_9CREN|nr:hypothetical protein [Acidianus brierleyi]AWR94964.1 hypothetical protein DFR85_10525 [Acidianus brierleyi]